MKIFIMSTRCSIKGRFYVHANGSNQTKGYDMRGAGGTAGGSGQFLIGLAMFIGGIYLLLNSIIVSAPYGFGARLYNVGGFSVTSGMVMIPFMFGVGIMFYDVRKWYGWLLAGGSLLALIFGTIASIHFRFAHMSAFDLITILILAVGGLGLLLRSFRTAN